MDLCALPETAKALICDKLTKKDLVSLAKTCRSLPDTCYDKKFWKTIDLEQKDITESSLHGVLDRGVEVAGLHGARIHFERDVIHPRNYAAARLTHLDLSRVTFIEDCGSSSASSSGSALIRLIQRCRSLKALSLNETQCLTGPASTEIAKNKDLVTLSLHGAFRRDTSPDAMTEIMREWRKLRELDIGENAFGAEGTNNILSAAPASLTRLSITGWIARCPSFKELHLIKQNQMEENDIHSLRGLSQLNKLTLRSCYRLQPTWFSGFGHLQVLNVPQCFIGGFAAGNVDMIKSILAQTTVTRTVEVGVAMPKASRATGSIWDQRIRDIISGSQ
ncbi:hypothetical protein AAVH_23169 [Aphelenchoides avenae]|nr:hypothetical protein AAVH_23169 [Aphelenchus avenae]